MLLYIVFLDHGLGPMPEFSVTAISSICFEKLNCSGISFLTTPRKERDLCASCCSDPSFLYSEKLVGIR